MKELKLAGSRGGARQGAGRPSKGLVNMGMRIKVEDAEFLRKTANEVGITIAEVIHILIEDYVTNVHHEFSRFDAEQ